MIEIAEWSWTAPYKKGAIITPTHIFSSPGFWLSKHSWINNQGENKLELHYYSQASFITESELGENSK